VIVLQPCCIMADESQIASSTSQDKSVHRTHYQRCGEIHGRGADECMTILGKDYNRVLMKE
jgi:hypothetical protein